MAHSILWQAQADIIAMAADVGIDGSALLQRLPAAGQLLTGSAVPTLSPRYRGKCYVMHHQNNLANGQSWPWLKLHTFKHGGISRIFNGLQWLQQHPLTRSASVPHPTSTRPVVTPPVADWRPAHFSALQAKYATMARLEPSHPWVQQRFQGDMTLSVLARTSLRARGHQLLLPLTDAFGNHTGFQSLTLNANTPKRFWLRQQGLLKGSFGLIAGQAGPVALCEGLATALSIALAWPGTIYIGLCANNLNQVRQHLASPVVIFADDDRWRPSHGNPGYGAALASQQPQDRLVSPQFSSKQLLSEPTDFNDLHQLAGKEALTQQILPHWLENF